jgi:hypothetical protein
MTATQLIRELAQIPGRTQVYGLIAFDPDQLAKEFAVLSLTPFEEDVWRRRTRGTLRKMTKTLMRPIARYRSDN